MSRDQQVPVNSDAEENSNKSRRSRTVNYWKEQPKLFFKTGALNHSATLPSLEIAELFTTVQRTKYGLCKHFANQHLRNACLWPPEVPRQRLLRLLPACLA